MQLTIATINPGDSGPQVADLQDALIRVLESGLGPVPPAPGDLPPEELQILTEGLKQDRARSFFGEATAKLVSYFRVRQGLGDGTGGVVDDATAARLNEVIKSLAAGGNGEPKRFIVRGHVKGARPGQCVRVYDEDFRGEECLGQVLLDARCRYELSYGVAQFKHAERGTADLRVTVHGPDGGELVSSDLVFNAGPETEIDLTIGPGSEPLPPSEYERYLAELEGVLQGVKLIEISARDRAKQKRDLDFLAGETGIDRRHIAWLVQAAKLAHEVRSLTETASGIDLQAQQCVPRTESIPPEVFYGWLRRGLPGDWNALRALRISELRTALLAALDENIIPAGIREQIDGILLWIPNPEATELAGVLGVAALPADRLGAVLAEVDGVEGVSDEVLSRLVERKALAAHEAERLGLTVSLHRLAGREPSLVTAMLDSEFASVKTGRLEHARDLAALEPREWEKALETAGIPVPQGWSRPAYARSLAMEAASAYPETAFMLGATRGAGSVAEKLSQLETVLGPDSRAITRELDALDLTDLGDRERETLREAHTSLRELANVHPGLGLHEVLAESRSGAEAASIVEERLGWLQTVFERNPEVSFLGLDYLPDSPDLQAVDFGPLSDDARKRVLTDLKAHQRIHSVTNNAVPAREIMQAGFHSASTIALTPTADFAEKAGLPEGEARLHHGRAEQVANDAAHNWLRLYEQARDRTATPVRAIPSLDQFFMPLPGFTKLINEQPWCECERCQSVLSPAAYFVDLLHYIEQHILDHSFKGQERHPLHLKMRRPDLWKDLELTCKNTTDYVPYLDVVNEILERYLREVLDVSGLYEYLAHAQDERSFKQPFNLPMERLGILLGHFGLSRHDVARAMVVDDGVRARARLSMSLREYDLVTTEQTSDAPFLLQLFRLESNVTAADEVIAPVEMATLLQATELTHEVMEAALKTKFVGADGSSNAAIEVVLDKRDRLDVQNNSEVVKQLTLRRLDRLHRFVRLWRKLPWTIEELDYVLGRTPAVPQLVDLAPQMTIWPGTLGWIVDLLDLNAEWSLPIEELMALIDVFPPNGLREPASLFDQLFNQQPFLDRDGRWPPAPETRFTHPAWSGAPASSPGVSDPTNNTLSRLLAGLQLEDKELVELVAGLENLDAIDYRAVPAGARKSIALSGASISALYRHARVSRLLKLEVGDLIKVLRLTPRGARPATPVLFPDPGARFINDFEDARSVIELAGWQKERDFSFDEIMYVTGRPAKPAGALDPGELADEVIASVKAERSLEFVDTVFTQIGLTEIQSRRAVLANVGSAAGIKPLEVLKDGRSYRIKAGASISAVQVTDADPDLLKDLLRKYDAIHVLDVALGSRLGLSPEEMGELRALVQPLVTGDLKAICRAMQGEPALPADKDLLIGLIDATLRYRTLFKNKVFDLSGLRFVRDRPDIFFESPVDPREPRFPSVPLNLGDPAITTRVVRNVAAYAALASATDAGFTTASGPADVKAIQDVLRAGIGGASDEDLAKALRTDQTRIAALKPHLANLPGNPFDALGVLARCLGLTKQLGVSGETLKLMVAEGPTSAATFEALSRAAEDVFGAFRAKYPKEQTFQEKMEPYEDKLRARKRDALVDYLVTHWPELFTGPGKLYEYFLIDVLLGGCARTSRVVAGISSLQLYVHRVLMNLEHSRDWDGQIPPGNGVYAHFREAAKRAEWQWREHYRVWEANRKVFLYPENYIEPELRDDKTPLFEELEDTLLLQEISESNVHDSYAKFLTGFDEVARLSIAGAYYEQAVYTSGATGDEVNTVLREDMLHLFGVTQDSPPVYYYRVIEKTASEAPRISAWHKLNLQIPVRKVSPISFEGRLYVFWLETTTRPMTTFVKGDSHFGGYRHAIRVKYSTLRADGVWAPPQSLGFSDGVATEETLLVDDPQSGLEAFMAKEVKLQELRKELSRLEAVVKQKIEAVTVAAAVWSTAAARAADAVWLANHQEELLAHPDDYFRRAAEVTAWVAGNDYLLIGYVDWAQYERRWHEANPLWGGPMNPGARSFMLRDATALMAIGAVNDWVLKTGERDAAQRGVTEAKQDVEDHLKAPDAKVSVRWDRSLLRNHREPLDNYKPERWEWDRVYPEVYKPLYSTEATSIRLMLVPRDEPIRTDAFQLLTSHEVDLHAGVLFPQPPTNKYPDAVFRINNIGGKLQRIRASYSSYEGQEFYVASFWLNSLSQAGDLLAVATANPAVQIVNGQKQSLIIESKGSTVWMRYAFWENEYRITQLGTTLTATLAKELGHKGASGLLEAHFQGTLKELPPRITPVEGWSRLEIPESPFDAANPYRTYFRETFFHVPFLVANHLNSQQDFAAAQRWYHYIFDPTSPDREPWHYRELRELSKTPASLRELLIGPGALAAYRADPFNPHAIARTRLSAYQKSIVMKYIDNLLDWGDSLFAQFTMESINEATMLYVMAQDILGPRPRILGSCGEGKASPKTYENIRPGLTDVSDFLVELEAPREPVVIRGGGKREARKLVMDTSAMAARRASTQASMVSDAPSLPAAASAGGLPGGGVPAVQTPLAIRELRSGGIQSWIGVGGTPLERLRDIGGDGAKGLPVVGSNGGLPPIPGNKTGNIDFIRSQGGVAAGRLGAREGEKIEPYKRYELERYDLRDRIPPDTIEPGRGREPLRLEPPILQVIPPKQPVFCIPPNRDLLAYWDRVDDRLFKIRNCMDISGVRRRLELFSPELDPRMLVRLKEAGLSLDEVLNSTSGNLPPYRFSYLIDKAKQYAGTLQSFGAQLLSALEKRDGEELSHLRAVHEQNLLVMRTRMTQLEVDAAEDTIEGLRRQKLAFEYRQDHYVSLSEVGQISSERKQQELQKDAAGYRALAGIAQVLGSVLSIIPDVGAPTAMKFGGSQLGAAGRAVADGLNAVAAFHDTSASMAGMEASNQRRDQEWKHQAEMAKREIAQLDKSITAAELRRDIALESQKVHEQTIKQTEELFDLFREKFSSLDRYRLLSKDLRQLYRLAFNSALSMAKMAEQAYRAERTEDDGLLSGRYWDAESAGLLAGEKLLVELQGLEQQYIETNYRELEIEQSFSLAQFAPNELAELRLTGECEVQIPEWFFDLFYPGHYRRRLKAVRMTIPCVTGPHTNVGATLRLLDSEIRLSKLPLPLSTPPPLALDPPTAVPRRHTVVIATSKGQFDAGVFDFNFRDERYMPFEGAGAISKWQISLPKSLRVFDYGTISDVILHLSYTAELDEGLRQWHDGEARELIKLLSLETGGPRLSREFSLRNELPDAFHRLRTSPLHTEIDFTIDSRHFPLFLAGSAPRAVTASLHVISPLKELQDTTLAIGMKAATRAMQDFKDVSAPSAPSEGNSGGGLKEFDFGDVLASSPGTKGVSKTLMGSYLIKLTALAAELQGSGEGTIDPQKLHDIILRVNYRLAPAGS